MLHSSTIKSREEDRGQALLESEAMITLRDLEDETIETSIIDVDRKREVENTQRAHRGSMRTPISHINRTNSKAITRPQATHRTSQPRAVLTTGITVDVEEEEGEQKRQIQ